MARGTPVSQENLHTPFILSDDVDGIKYTVTGDSQVAMPKNNYSSDVNIPETIVNESKTNRVNSITNVNALIDLILGNKA